MDMRNRAERGQRTLEERKSEQALGMRRGHPKRRRLQKKNIGKEEHWKRKHWKRKTLEKKTLEERKGLWDKRRGTGQERTRSGDDQVEMKKGVGNYSAGNRRAH
ncbi:hypothetical protein HRR83_002387 [Exophiala dermatitidis]|uniref:Uncharacterized protein n=1 Tax=Exophiala dermatitidis TaxID=5970 RepID=A0AAN6EX46_EXODE|nr:hypothetical protein HRR74_002464 [Exophiala dermatitidis]KAJ4525460.1 hypothetical protein HRR73_002190 [Exophiala dermatitidis]KAJ4536775.1 hypothetical protein HRR76_004802 [Exophiala dermatitidis]KAJ4555622.1 hypothetical protein HRR77_001551 [Exophiala dermatitidis]KAJ4568925.1 hypothetical protein HRR81_006582 [Exophiala dermatitidis]